MKTLVALVGEQPLPNVLPAFFLKPQEMLLVYSHFTESAYQRLAVLLSESGIRVHGLKCTDEYETVSIAQELGNELAQRGFQDSMGFNLTGGTKAMVLAAYQCARDLGSEVMYFESGRGKSRLYQYHFAESGGLNLITQQEIPPLVSTDQFLDAQLGKGAWRELGYSKDVGGRFESAVGDALRDVVDEIKAGIRFLGDERGKREQADLDLVIRVGNQFGVIEVKDQKKAALDALKQLHYLSGLLGTFTKKLWVLSREASPEHRAVIEATRTTVIELPEFASGILNDESMRKLKEKVSQALR